MKIRYLLVLLVFSWGSCMAARQGERVKIAGEVVVHGAKRVLLYQVKDGRMQLHDSVRLNEAGKFELRSEIDEEGFYTIGDGKDHLFPIYLKCGDNVKIRISDGNARLVGRNTTENKILYDWEGAVVEIRLQSFFHNRLPVDKQGKDADFFAALERVAAGKQVRVAAVKTNNKKFDRLMKEKIQCDLDFYALRYLTVSQDAASEGGPLSSYYQTIVSDKKYRDHTVLELPWGKDMFMEYVNFALESDASEDFSNEKAFSFIGSDCLKGEYVLARAERFCKSYDQYLQLMEAYGRYFILPTQKLRIKKMQQRLAYSKPGTSAPDFACEDREGRRVALSDFLGKMVVVDVWATWCEPCRKEMPYMKELEEELNGEEIVFISMCIGARVERGIWLRILEQDKLNGIQVFMPGWRSSFATDYKITGVPRFLVFDKKGNIVSVNAPRPSTPGLKKIITDELKK